MRRLLWSLLSASIAPLLIVTPAQARPGQDVVRGSFIDYPRGNAAPSSNLSERRTCVTPASDLCTDYKGTRVRWANPSVTYRVNTNGGPGGTLAAVEGAFDVWQNETKSSDVATVYGADASAISFTYGGTSATSGASYDGKNVVSFADLSSSCSRCLAVTSYWYTRGTNEMAEFDITLNTQYTWATNGSSNAYDVMDIVTHEAGHSLVLGDLYKSTDAALTMYGYGSPGETSKTTLGAGDVLGVRNAYPVG